MEIQIFKDTVGNYYVQAGEYKVRLADGTRHDGTTIGHFDLVKKLPIGVVSNCADDLEWSLYTQVVYLKEKVKKLEFMIDNGLGEEDMLNDITYPSGN